MNSMKLLITVLIFMFSSSIYACISPIAEPEENIKNCQLEANTDDKIAPSPCRRVNDQRAAGTGHNRHRAHSAGNRGWNGQYCGICCPAVIQTGGA